MVKNLPKSWWSKFRFSFISLAAFSSPINECDMSVVGTTYIQDNIPFMLKIIIQWIPHNCFFCRGITWLLEPSPSATWRSSTWRPPSCGAWKCRRFLRQLLIPRQLKILRPAPGGAWGDCGLTTGCKFGKELGVYNLPMANISQDDWSIDIIYNVLFFRARSRLALHDGDPSEAGDRSASKSKDAEAGNTSLLVMKVIGYTIL